MRVLLAGDNEDRSDDRTVRRPDGKKQREKPEDASGNQTRSSEEASPEAQAPAGEPTEAASADRPQQESEDAPPSSGVEGGDGPEGGSAEPGALPEGFETPNKKSSFSVSDDDNLPREASILVPDYDRFLEGHGQRPGHLASDRSDEPAPQAPTSRPEPEPEPDEDGWMSLEWEPGLWGAENEETASWDAQPEGPHAEEDDQDLRHHRFGLRLGRHQEGNFISKLKAHFKKGEPEDEDQAGLREAEENEAAEERIEPNERYKEIEVYPIRPPYGHVRILFDEETKEYIYQALEPVLTKTERDILTFIEESLVDSLTVSPEELENMDDRAFITERFNDVIFDYSIILHEDEEKEDEIKRKLLYYVLRDFIGHGRIDVIMEDPYIEDISCDGPKIPIFLYHRKYESVRSTVVFPDHSELDSYVIKMAQRSSKHISIAEPILDATLPDGSRLQSTLGKEVSAGGSTFTIRKFRPDPFTPPDLVLFRTMSAEMLAYLWIAVQHSSSVLYSGGTASGKTTSLNAILLFIPPQMKIVTIEDTREVNLPHENWIAGITRHGFGPRDQFGRQAGEIDMFQLLKNALRQRPEYIIVGEVRGHEAYSLFQAMATGHAAYGTMHADSVDAVIHRLESDPINVPRNLLEALDVVSVQIQTRVGGKRVRRTKQISEIVGIDPHTKEILTNEVFRWVPKDDSFKFTGISYILERIQLEKALPDGSMLRELSRRAAIIEWMIEKRIQDYREVSRIVSAYYREPEIVMGLVEGRLSGDEIPSGLREIAERTSEEEEVDPLSAAALESSKVSGIPEEEEPDEAEKGTGQELEEPPTAGVSADADPTQSSDPVSVDESSDASEPAGFGFSPEAPREQPDPADLLRPQDEGESPVQGGWGSTRADPEDPASSDAKPAGDEDAEGPAPDSNGVWGGAPGLLDAAQAHADAEEKLERLSSQPAPDPADEAEKQPEKPARGPAAPPSHKTKKSSGPSVKPSSSPPSQETKKSSGPSVRPSSSPPSQETKKSSGPSVEPSSPPPSQETKGPSQAPASNDGDNEDRDYRQVPASKKLDHSRPKPEKSAHAAPGGKHKEATKQRFKHRKGASRPDDLHRAVDAHLAARKAKDSPAKDWSPKQAEAWLSQKEEEERSRKDSDARSDRASGNKDKRRRKQPGPEGETQ